MVCIYIRVYERYCHSFYRPLHQRYFISTYVSATLLLLYELFHYQYYSAVSFVTDVVIMEDTNVEILVTLRHYFKLCFKAVRRKMGENERPSLQL